MMAARLLSGRPPVQVRARAPFANQHFTGRIVLTIPGTKLSANPYQRAFASSSGLYSGVVVSSLLCGERFL